MEKQRRKNQGGRAEKRDWEEGRPDTEERSSPRSTARDAAMRYLEYRARSSGEVENYLKRQGYREDEIQDCMGFLEDCGFVNDSDYCRRYVEYSIEKGRGPRRIQQELSQKGIPDEIAREELSRVFSSDVERDCARKQAEKAIGEPKDGGYTEKDLARAARRLASQGYRTQVVYDIIDRLRRETRREEW